MMAISTSQVQNNIDKIGVWIQKEVSIAPLITFRIVFGLMMLMSTIRFWMKGWINTQYIEPKFHFTFMGFDWIHPLNPTGMYLIFFVIALTTLFITIGFFYRFSIIIFFLSFTYVELIDITYYLNHYYFISVISFLMIFVPAGNYFSLDIYLKPENKITHVPLWIIGIIRFQLGIVYCYAGLAKLNYDWLFQALPMKIWLPSKSYLPIVGSLMYKEWVAYLFSWFGAVYDLFIVFFLLNSKTRNLAFIAVLVFHIATAIFFPAIGMFPYIMILSTLIFFSGDFHLKLIDFFQKQSNKVFIKCNYQLNIIQRKAAFIGLGFFFILQLIIPLRFLNYPQPLFWFEEGYRFSWRVMLMEKAGYASFYAKDKDKTYEINNAEFLTPQQEKMMSTQPDMILRYAHYLAEIYEKRGLKNPRIYANVYVALNGRPSQAFVNQEIDLSKQLLSFKHYNWVLPFNNNH